MTDKNSQPISVEDLKEYGKGKLLQIPSWEDVDRDYIVVKVRTVDFTPHLMELEHLPNELMAAAQEVFKGKDKKPDAEKAKEFLDNNSKQLKDMMPIIDAVVEEALLEPTWEDFEDHKPLDFQQKMAIFENVIRGVKQVEPFRARPGQNDTSGGNSQ